MVNATAPSPGVRLRITTSSGEDISGTRLGEKLFLRIEMDQESIFGIFAKNLKAIGGDDEDSIDLLDDRGCPTDPIIFPGLQKIADSRDLQGSFEAFKFSDTSVVRFQVNVQFCVDECNPVDCGDGIQSFGRRKRSVNSSTESTKMTSMVTLPPMGTTKVPEPYASRLVYDSNLGQEVIDTDNTLYKEIFVDSGTKVDSYRDPFLRSDNDGGELFVQTLNYLLIFTLQFSSAEAMRTKRLSVQLGLSSSQPVLPSSSSSSASSPPVCSACTPPGGASLHKRGCLTTTPCTVEEPQSPLPLLPSIRIS